MDKTTANRSSGSGFVAALVAVLAVLGIVIVAGIWIARPRTP